MTRLQLLVDDDRNETALRTLLDERYSVLVGEKLLSVDCYVVDDRTLPEYRERLEERVQNCHPTFCPVLLIHREDTRVNVGLSAPDASDGPQLVDETVTAPIEKQTIFRRIDNLIARRNQSIDLTRQYEQVEARFLALFAAIPDPAFVLDTDGTLIEVNDAFDDTFGVTRSDVLGEELATVPGLDLDAAIPTDRVLGEDAEDQSDVQIEEFTDKRGEKRFANLSIQTVTVDDEPYTVGVLNDVTDLKEKTERLEEFASVASHDLRNPLQVAQGRLELLADRYPIADEHLDPIERSMDRIEDLIEKLQTVARTGDDESMHEEVRLVECANDAWKTVETNDVQFVTDDADVTLRADRGRMRQLFENLFRNAIEHGGDDVTVRVGSLADGFYLEDDGIGIPPEKHGDIFRMGYSTRGNSNGLGLNIVAEVADAHDWEVTVTDSEDGGARFEITSVFG